MGVNNHNWRAKNCLYHNDIYCRTLLISSVMNLYKDYIVTTNLDLDLVVIKNSCYKMKDLINKNFKKKIVEVNYSEDEGKLSPFTTQGFEHYNLLMYGFPGFHSLYFEIQKLFQQLNQSDEKYYIQCWLNMYEKDNFVDWHDHYPPKSSSWHGFFCVDCEPSKTTYQLPNISEPVNIISKNNLLVLSKSNGDRHRTWPWEYNDRERITIAFDIVPSTHTGEFLNHWIPI